MSESPSAVVPCAIVGAGAAGLTAAIFAARGGASPLLLESKPRPGAKIRISGGGRCNVLPSVFELGDFHTAGSKNALRNLLAAWPLEAVHEFFERELGVALTVERETGKVFPVSDDAGEVLVALIRECEHSGARLVGDSRVESVSLREDDLGRTFELAIADRPALRARSLVLTTGGLSIPKTGSDGRGFEIARSLGHSSVATYPALVPLSTNDAGFTELAGIALRVRLRAVRGDEVLEERVGNLLFTHRGFSGPTVLDLSHHVARDPSGRVRIVAHWIGERDGDWDEALRRGGKQSIGGIVDERLPKRLARLLCSRAGVDAAKRASELSREERLALVGALENCELPISGNEGYRTAEVTGGGIPLAEVSTKTLESRIVPGLYFAGEIVDVTGRIGGFNFLWSWISGRTVGRAVAAALARSAS